MNADSQGSGETGSLAGESKTAALCHEGSALPLEGEVRR
jgi:hypothetical protein